VVEAIDHGLDDKAEAVHIGFQLLNLRADRLHCTGVDTLNCTGVKALHWSLHCCGCAFLPSLGAPALARLNFSLGRQRGRP